MMMVDDIQRAINAALCRWWRHRSSNPTVKIIYLGSESLQSLRDEHDQYLKHGYNSAIPDGKTFSGFSIIEVKEPGSHIHAVVE